MLVFSSFKMVDAKGPKSCAESPKTHKKKVTARGSVDGSARRAVSVRERCERAGGSTTRATLGAAHQRAGGSVEAGTSTDQLVCFTDLMATFADILEVQLPPNAGPDSFSFLPAMTGQKSYNTPARKVTNRNGILPFYCNNHNKIITRMTMITIVNATTTTIMAATITTTMITITSTYNLTRAPF